MSTSKNAFVTFAQDLAANLRFNRITLDQAYDQLNDLGYTVTDSGCFYRTFTMVGSRSKFYIHIWGTLVPKKSRVVKFMGIAWGNKDGEFDRLEM